MCLYTFVPLPFVSGNLNLLDSVRNANLDCYHCSAFTYLIILEYFYWYVFWNWPSQHTVSLRPFDLYAACALLKLWSYKHVYTPITDRLCCSVSETQPGQFSELQVLPAVQSIYLLMWRSILFLCLLNILLQIQLHFGESTSASQDFSSVTWNDLRGIVITLVANIILISCRCACACLNELLWNNNIWCTLYLNRSVWYILRYRPFFCSVPTLIMHHWVQWINGLSLCHSCVFVLCHYKHIWGSVRQPIGLR